MTAVGTDAQWRVDFDAEVTFSNGGGLRADGFRLDVPGPDVTDDEVGRLFVRHLGLLMVGSTTITRKQLIQEPHKGGRGVAAGTGPRRVVDLAWQATGTSVGRTAGPPPLPGLVDLPATLARLLGSDSDEVSPAALAAYELRGRALVLHSDGKARLTAIAAAWLAGEGVALVATDADDAGHDISALLAAGVPVVAGLSGLDRLPPGGFRLHVVPTALGAGPGTGGLLSGGLLSGGLRSSWPGNSWPAAVYAVVEAADEGTGGG